MKHVKTKRVVASICSMSLLGMLFTGFAPAAAAEPYPETNKELILELKFDDETVSDTSGKNHRCTPVGEITFSAGRDGAGKALHLDNRAVYSAENAADAAQYIVFDDLALGTEDFTVMFWYKAPEHEAQTVLFGNQDWEHSDTGGLLFADKTDGVSVQLTLEGSGTMKIEPGVRASVRDGSWHHFAGTFDRDGDAVLYIDGEQQGSTSIASCNGKSLDVPGQPYCLGADGTKHVGTYDGDVDEFCIYRGIVTEEEIRKMRKPFQPEPEQEAENEPDTSSAEKEVPEIPTAQQTEDNRILLKVGFDDNTASDVQRGIEGKLIGSPEFTAGKSGQCIHIVNSSDVAGETKPAQQYVSYGNQLQLGKNDFSVLFWYKADAHDTDKEGAIFSNKDYASGSNPGVVFADMKQGMAMNVHALNGDRHEIRIWDPAGLTDGNWHHIAGTFDRDGDAIFYVDGKELGRSGISDIQDQTMDIAGHAYNLGADGVGQCGLENGYIDELYVYQGIIPEQELADMHIQQELQARIEQCREMASSSGRTEAEKQMFMQKINEIEKRAQAASTPEEYKALLTELENARADFLKPGESIACFDVMSDTHISSANDSSGNYQGMHRAIQNIIKNYPDTMGIFNCGDYTNNGYEEQNKNFFEIIKTYEDQVEFTTCLGNHDVRWKPWKEIYERYLRYNAPYMPEQYVKAGKVYHDKWLGPDRDQDGKGDYHFIVMNSEYRTKDKSYFSDEQLDWFREKLAEDNEDGSKPVFVFTHEPLKDTVHWSNDWSLGDQDGVLKEIMRDYPNTMVFTGHIHNGIDLVRAEQRDWGYAIDIPGFVSCDQGQPRGQYGWHVTIYEDRVVLDLYDYINDTFVQEKQQTLWIPNQLAQRSGKILDVDFDDETASDRSGSGNDGVIHGDVEFVEGRNGGKAVHIVNSPAGCIGKAEQYIDFGSLNLDKENFTVLFWYKADGTLQQETAMFGNKDWSTGQNDGIVFGDMKQGVLFNVAAQGSGRIETKRYPAATDGKWHLIAATVDRNGTDLSVDDNTQGYDETAVASFYIDGQLAEQKNIDAIKEKTVETGLPYVLGADGLYNLGMEDGYFDDLKVYKNALGAAEIRTLMCPFTVTPGGTAAVVVCNPDFLDNNWVASNLKVAYMYLDEENAADTQTRRIPADSDENTFVISELKPNTAYKLRVVTVEKSSAENITDVYELHFTTKAEDGKVPFDLKALKTALEDAAAVDMANKTTQAAVSFQNTWNKAKEVLREAQISDILETDLTQAEIDVQAFTLQNAVKAIRESAAPAASVKVEQTEMKAAASSDCGENNAEGEGNGAAQNAIDGSKDTYWHNNWRKDDTSEPPHWIRVDFEKAVQLSRVDYLPRQNHTNGHWADYTMYIIDKQGREVPVIEHGKIENPGSKEKQTITIAPIEAYGVKFLIHDAVGGSGTAAEIDFFTPEVQPQTVSDITVHFYALINDELHEIQKLTGLTTQWINGRQCIAAEILEQVYGKIGFAAKDLQVGSAKFLHRDLNKGAFWYAPAEERNGTVYASTINHKETRVEGYPYDEFDVLYQPNQTFKGDSSADAEQLAKTESFYTVTLDGEVRYYLTGTDVTITMQEEGNDYWICTGADGQELEGKNGVFHIPAIKQAYTFKRVMVEEEHTVIFQDRDGKPIGEPQIVKHGQDAAAPTVPVHEGYTFIGWDKAFTNVTSDLTITAQYAPILCKVTIDGKQSTVQYGYKLGTLLSKQPVKQGYIFDRWVDEKGSTVTADTVVYSDMTITSQWHKSPSEPEAACVITFNGNGGNGSMQPVEVKKGTAFQLPDCGFAAPEGMNFNGWDKGAAGTTIIITEDVELTAQWIAAAKPQPDETPVTPPPAPAPSSGNGGGAVPTGDNTHLLLWGNLALLSGGAVITLYRKRNKK